MCLLGKHTQYTKGYNVNNVLARCTTVYLRREHVQYTKRYNVNKGLLRYEILKLHCINSDFTSKYNVTLCETSYVTLCLQ